MKRMRQRLLALFTAFTMATSLFCATGPVCSMEIVQAAEGTLIYQSDASAASDAVDFSALTEEDWSRKTTVTYAYTNDEVRNVTKNFVVGAKVTIDSTAYATLETEGNHVKIQGAAKLGDWEYTGGDSWPYLDKNAFTQEGDNYTADIEINFADKNPSQLMEIDFEIVGVGFAGILNFSNVTVSNLPSEDQPLDKKDPSVLSDLATEADFSRWGTEEGYQYTHGSAATRVPSLSYDAAGQRLAVALDYSADSKQSWSEAKITYTPEEGADVSSYNQMSVDVTWPSAFTNYKIKFFADGIINKDTAIDQSSAEDVGGGMKKATVTLGFTPTSTPLTQFTIGIVGVSTGFQGNIYIDNLVLSQNDPTADYTKITETVKAAAVADISNRPSTVKTADSNAGDSARALFAYLSALSASDQVIFGHQNDVSRAVNTAAELGDVEDVTGSVSGMFGLDSLALTGSEAGGTDAASALANSIAYSKKAAENGALVTLSMHMPNFTSSKIIKNQDGTYNFYNCNFDESKDLTNDSAKKILPGGSHNEVFNAYLDIVAEYALALQADNIPVIFRPLHENTGSWFWWGTANSAETYKSLYRYTKDYLESKNVHNMLWVYSPNGPLTSREEYLSRYPGDEYVDILAFDYYDDYNTYPAVSDGSFFTHLNDTCAVVSSLAKERGKIAAIAECGVRAMKKDGSDIEGLLVKGSPVREEVTGTNWYQEVSKVAQNNDIPYFLVWANFSDTNFYVPYKYNDEYGHEMINEFIRYYNDSSSIFGNGTNFYNNISTLAGAANEPYTNVHGYMVYPFDMDTVLSETTLSAVVKNADKVQFVIENSAAGTKLTLDAAASGTLYQAELTAANISAIGAADTATLQLVADGAVISTLTNMSIGKEKEKAPAEVIDNFDYYSGSNGLLDAAYSSNAAAGCSAEFTLDEKNKIDGNYGGAFHYVLKTSGSEVWTGRIKSQLNGSDYSAYNAIQMWVQPDGKGQKLVVQISDSSGEDFEVYLTDFVKGTKARYVTIPLSSFQGKNGGTLDVKSISKFAIWCNSIIPQGHEGTWEVDSTIYFDGIQFVSVDASRLAQADENGFIITDQSLVSQNSQNPGDNQKPGDNQQSGGNQKPDSDQNTNTQKKPVKVKKLSITAPSKKLAAGKKVKLTVAVSPKNASNKAVTWKTDNKKYAEVDKNGKVTLKKAGIGKTVTITAMAKDGSKKKAAIRIKIMKHAVKSVKLKAPAKTLKAGKSMTLKTTVKTTGKSANKSLSWKSSNTKYAAVNKKGKVTAKKAGKGKTVTITASSTDGSNKKAAVKIKIK